MSSTGLPLLKRERTLAITVGPWGGVWFTGKRRLIWRLCLGFVAITYVPAEMTQIIEAWLDKDGPFTIDLDWDGTKMRWSGMYAGDRTFNIRAGEDALALALRAAKVARGA